MSRDVDSLEGRVALVTGGARGIGLAIATALHRRGACVVIADDGGTVDGRTPNPLVAPEAAASFPERMVAFSESIASPAQARAAVDQAVETFGALDIVVNNAAVLRDAFLFKAQPEDWDAVVATNLSGPFYVLAAAAEVLRTQANGPRSGWGRVINIVSSAGLYGNFGQAAYASAKAGLTGLTRVAALDLQRSKVCCNAVAPFAHTRVTDLIKPANEAQARYKERALRIGPEHVARFVSFLASDAAAEITGQLFGVRGREIMLFQQPRPLATLIAPEADWSPADLAAPLAGAFADRLTPLETDLEAFNTDPVL